MRHLLLLVFFLISGLDFFAQTQVQQGRVKTRGRMVNGKHVPGIGLPGAVVTIKDGSAIGVKKFDGAFSFITKGEQFVVQSVSKNGYILVDADAAPKTYRYSENTLDFVMETPEQNFDDQRNAQNKFRAELEQKLRQQEAEIKRLKKENKITQEEYYKLIQELDAQRDQNQKLIIEMAKRYAALDYDTMDDFYRQVCYYMEECDFVKADSLLRSRGDVKSQVEANLIKQDIVNREKEELARRCYSFYESFRMQHANDSATKYIELRASLDTTNVEWQYEAATYLKNYLADYNASLKYNLRGLRHSISQYGEQAEWTGAFYNNIASLYSTTGNYSEALKLYLKALDIHTNLFGAEHSTIGTSYNNIGNIYLTQGNYPLALEYFNKAMSIQEEQLGTEHPDIAATYCNIGGLYNILGEHEKALEYMQKDRLIQEKTYGLEHPNTVVAYNNIGGVYDSQGNYPLALEYYQKALEIQKKILAPEHPSLATTLHNIGGVYYSQDKHSKALEYLNMGLNIKLKALGAEHPSVATSYNTIGVVYQHLGDYSVAKEYYLKAKMIREKTLGADHPNMASIYSNIALCYQRANNYPMAIEYMQKAIDIKEKHLGKEHMIVANSYYGMGDILTSQKNYIGALEHKQKALNIYEKKLGPKNKLVLHTKANVLWLMSKDLTRMKDYVFVANIVDGDTPAKQKGMDGEYIMFELGDWCINDTISMFDVSEELKGKSKSIVVMQDGVISQYHFEDAIGVMYDLKYVGQNEKKRITKAYMKWKKKQK